MTTRSGSRDGGAGRSHGDDGLDSEAGGAGGAGDRDDDPELRAMRAVWLSMRDEAPPDGGLAELLVAARAKAETMQARPAFWQRLVAGLRRPPAMALATVMVLVCGAVLLTRHADPTEAQRAASRATDLEIGSGLGLPPAAREVPAPVVPGPAGVGSRGSGAGLDDSTKLPAPAAGSTEATATLGGGAPDPARPLEETASAPRAAAAPHEADRQGARGTRGAGAAGTDSMRAGAASGPVSATAGSTDGLVASGQRSAAADKEVAPARPPLSRRRQPAEPIVVPSEAPKLQRRVDAPGMQRGAFASDRDVERTQRGAFASDRDVKRTQRGAAAPEPARSLDDKAEGSAPRAEAARSEADEAKQPGARTDATTTERAAPPANTTRPGSRGGSLAQLYLQCESAARRGDCPAVKRIVERITTTDRGYRARLAKDSPIAKCLAE